MTNLDDEYTQLLRTLLPPGPAWDEEDPLLKGLAPSLAQAHQHADNLMIEINPAQSVGLITRYEKLCGLPDKCQANRTQTIEERQQVLDAKVNTLGGINEAFFKKQLALLGYPTATIEQFQHRVHTPDPAWGDQWRYYWRVNIPAEVHVRWMSCASACNEAIQTWGDSAVECVINRQCPSHTQVLFAYLKGENDASH